MLNENIDAMDLLAVGGPKTDVRDARFDVALKDLNLSSTCMYTPIESPMTVNPMMYRGIYAKVRRYQIGFVGSAQKAPCAVYASAGLTNGNAESKSGTTMIMAYTCLR
jgi:hypothetical protein